LPHDVIKQHLIDPELCIRCDTCETSCPSHAITHDINNYVVDTDICNGCLDCIAGCPTGSIDNWRMVPRAAAYSVAEQLTWTELPAALEFEGVAEIPEGHAHGAPESAPAPVENLYTRENPLPAKLVETRRLTAAESPSEIRHIVLETAEDFAILEGQSIGIVPPGVDEAGRRHIMRLYSVANARGGEGGLKNRVALTVKRVLEDHQGTPHIGLCSNHVCDMQIGDIAEMTGPHGRSFLMPDDPAATLLMIATGTGVAPMRAMLLQRLLRRQEITGRQILFYGGRTPEEMPYYDDLLALPNGFADIKFAVSRVAGTPKRYVQDALRVQRELVADCLADENCYIYLCGLKGMESGVLEAFEAICRQNGTDWPALAAKLKAANRLHIETY